MKWNFLLNSLDLEQIKWCHLNMDLWAFAQKYFLKKDIEEITFVPVAINYTRTLEGESFPGELRG